jgi:peptide-methionine (S)-S-oxide reductase
LGQRPVAEVGRPRNGGGPFRRDCVLACAQGHEMSSQGKRSRDQQGADKGPQYRSVIYYHSPEQKSLAMASMKKLNESGVYSDPAVTEITEASKFWVAEDYHQDYYRLNKDTNPYCRVVISPKLKKLGME